MEKSYLFPTGAIRAIEKRLFDNNDMERMIDAEDAGKSFKIFNELSYADELLDMKDPEQYREVLAHDLKQVRDYLLSIAPNQNVGELMFASHDFHNFKTAFKAKLEDKTEVEGFSEAGMIDIAKLKEIIFDENAKTSLPEHYEKLIRDAKQELESAQEPQEIDSYFDKKYFTFTLQKAKEIKEKYLVYLVENQIDIANAKIIIRSKLLDRSFEEVEKDLVDSKNWKLDKLKDRYNEGLEGAVNFVKQNFLNEIILKELNDLVESKDFWRLEQTFDNYLMDVVKEAKIRTDGPVPMVGYFLAKKNAMKNIQIIMAGKVNNIEPEEIKKRVRNLY